MKNFRKNPASLRFMKTFLTAAERLSAAVHRDESDKSPFFVYSKEMSAVYPALENLAWELKVHHGAGIDIPAAEGAEPFELSAAFPVLLEKMSSEMKRIYPQVCPWYDSARPSVPQQLETVWNHLQEEPVSALDKYWLQNSLRLSLEEIRTKQEVLKQQMYDAIENRSLPQQVAGVMESVGYVVDEDQDDEIADILYDVGDTFLNGNRHVDSSQITMSVWDKLQKSWAISDVEQRLLWPLARPMAELGKVIRATQKKMAVLNYPARYLSEQLRNLGEIPSHEAANNMIYPSVSSEENSGLFWADGETLPGYLSPYLDDASFQKVNAEGVRWKQYEKQGDVLQLPEWRENFKAVLGDWCQMLSEDVEQFQGQIRHYFEGEQRRREAVEDGDVVSGRNAEAEKRFKEESLSFAGKLAAASAAAEKYAGVILNDSGIGQKTLAKISADKDWSEDDYRLLFHLAENFENNYHEHEGQLPVSAEEGNERFFEAFAMLPPSPEKHEMMKLMLSNFADRQLSIDGEIEMLSEDFISLAEEMQTEKYDLLEDFVGSGMELYPELRRLGQEKLAGDISYWVSGNYVIPFYMELMSAPGSCDEMLREIDGYESFSPEAQGFLRSLIGAYKDMVLPLHQESKQNLGQVWALNAGAINDDNPLAGIVRDYKEVLLREMDLGENRRLLENTYESEDKIYRDYRHYRQEREKFTVSDKVLKQALMQLLSAHR